MSYENYSNALNAGRKEYRTRLLKGGYPYLPVLEEILSYTKVEYEVSLGVCEVPLELIVGTKTKGRTNSFAANFMPLLDASSEFAGKWIRLYTTLEEEGLRDPVKVYEFMNRFYVQEGNKRVSILKYLNAYSVPCSVIRIVPKRTDTKENEIYYEFLDFYEVTGINTVYFSETGRFNKLLEQIGTPKGRNGPTRTAGNLTPSIFISAMPLRRRAAAGCRLRWETRCWPLSPCSDIRRPCRKLSRR